MTGHGQGQRVALVTGAGRGIGRAVARRMASDGYRVAVCDIDAEAGRLVAEELTRAGATATAVAADVSDARSVSGVCNVVTDRLGAPDILVNNAGVISASRFIDLGEEEWDRVLDVNLKGTYLCSRAVIASMVERRWGRIINIASDAGKTGEPWIAHYCASKFGIIGLTQSLALEYAAHGVTVNAVCPAICSTDMMDRLAHQLAAVDDGSVSRAQATMTAEIPMGRPVAPEEVADAVGFLAADSSRFISGQAINVSGAHEVH